LTDVTKNYLLLTLIFFHGLAQAQVKDNFSDGDFTSNPAWSGTAIQFTINSAQQLQLNNSSAGASYLTITWSSSTLDNVEWEFWVKQSFASSGSNYGRVYLVSDQPDLTHALNGYYLQFGEAGSNDAVELFRQTGTVSTSVCRAANGSIAASFAIRVKVKRDENGQWKLFADYAGGSTFVLQATGADQTYTTSLFFGISCVYTISNDTKFFYDDFSITAQPSVPFVPVIPNPPADTIPPALRSAQVTSDSTISLTFSETLDKLSGESLKNYSIDNPPAKPIAARLQSDLNSILLTFNPHFKNGFPHLATLMGIKDLAENVITDSNFRFTYFKVFPVQFKDLILTEILADPVPGIGLPGAEFVEIYNRSVNPIDLAGWKLSDGTSIAVCPTQIILPQQYAVITSAIAASQFSAYKNVLGVIGFPTLNNDADYLTIKSPAGLMIDSVNYSLSWYRDSDKQAGGWSLEMIDVNNICGEGDNWISSEDPSGGSPGKQNSVYADKPDATGPRMLRVVSIGLNQLSLTFDEKLERVLPSSGSFRLDPPLVIKKISFLDQSLRVILIDLNSDLELSQPYKLTVEKIYDCAGNLIQQEFSAINFELPESADSLDILINEILFNPRPGGVDFVEVYNNSDKYISLGNWKLGNLEDGRLKSIEKITQEDLTFPPHTYFVFTVDPEILKNNFPQGAERIFFQTTLPGLPDDSGSIALVNEQGKIVDYFMYDKGFHSKLLKDDEGVSLERISFEESTNDNQNWRSASAVAGFATPGLINSCSRPDDQVNNGNVAIVPEIFGPDGVESFTKINYQFDQPGFVGNIKVLDQQGRVIKTLANNSTLGTEGFFRWDGDREDGSKARTGFYLVWFEVFDVAGTVKTFRKRVIVASH
jgi:Lamin Tail Domain/Bacterial Ig-like domain